MLFQPLARPKPSIMSPSLVRETFDGISLSDGSNDDEIYLGDFERDILEPIAVIGFSFKFPQDATSTEPFWDMLMKGRCASTEFPKDRMNRAAFHHPDPSRPGTVRPTLTLQTCLTHKILFTSGIFRLMME